MTHTSTTPQRAARLAGFAAIGGALYILLKSAIETGHWSTEQILMPVIVGVTILAGHLVTSALRDWRLLSAAGFALVFVLGTGLTVYCSVGQQAKVAEAEGAQAADTAARQAEIAADAERVRAKRKAAEDMLDDARRKFARECNSGLGSRCRGIKATIDVYEAAVKGHDADLAALAERSDAIGPVQAAGVRPGRMAAVLAVFAADEATAREEWTRVFVLFEPFAFSLFLELGAIVAFGYGFAQRRVTVSANDNTPARVSSVSDDGFPQPPTRKPRPATVHPVLAALAGGPVASNDELAQRMGVTKGEASKRRQEVEHLLSVTQAGRCKRIGLAA